MEVGFISSDSIDYSAFGGKGVSTGDTRADIDAMVGHLNRTGGLAGRKVRPVIANINPAAASVNSEFEAACSQFTQDHHVLAVASLAFVPDNFRSCLAAHGIPYSASSVSSADDQVFSPRGTYFQADTASLDVRARTLVHGLFNAKYFTPRGGAPVKIGLLFVDSVPYQSAVSRALKPALASHGLHVTREASFAPYDNYSGYGQQASAMSSAQLRFNTAGITHVLSFEQNAGLSYPFMTAAESQQYHPRYGLTSQSLMQSFLAGNVPAAQQEGALAVGWLPVSDVVPSDQGANSSRAECLRIFKDAGQTFADATAESLALNYCDSALLLQAAANHAPAPLNARSLIAGFEALGTSYRSPSTFEVRFGVGRHDGADVYRLVHFVSACSCYRYSGSLRPFDR